MSDYTATIWYLDGTQEDVLMVTKWYTDDEVLHLLRLTDADKREYEHLGSHPLMHIRKYKVVR